MYENTKKKVKTLINNNGFNLFALAIAKRIRKLSLNIFLQMRKPKKLINKGQFGI
jgi:hypothetical protein